VVDRESAYEILEAKEAKAAKEAERLAKRKKKRRRNWKRKRPEPKEPVRAGPVACRRCRRPAIRPPVPRRANSTRYILRGILGSMKRR
jgi:hypothetical protein